MEIIRAAPNQIPTVAGLARRAYEQATHKKDFNEAVALGNWIRLTQTGDGVVLVVADKDGAPHGLLCGYKCLHIDTGRLTAQMWHWFVSDKARGWGIRLLWAFEKWAAEQKCERIAIGCLLGLWDSAHSKIYKRLGYQMEGFNFVKEK